MAVQSMCLDSMPIKLFDPPDQPYHPQNLQFSYQSFGRTTVTRRSCQALWFITWPWLHYKAGIDTVYYHTCCKAIKIKNITVLRGNWEPNSMHFSLALSTKGPRVSKEHGSRWTKHLTYLEYHNNALATTHFFWFFGDLLPILLPAVQ